MKITRLLGATVLAMTALLAVPALANDAPLDPVLMQPSELTFALPASDVDAVQVAAISLDVFTNFQWDPHALTAESCAAEHSADYCAAALGTATLVPAGYGSPSCPEGEVWVYGSGGERGSCVCVKPI